MRRTRATGTAAPGGAFPCRLASRPSSKRCAPQSEASHDAGARGACRRRQNALDRAGHAVRVPIRARTAVPDRRLRRRRPLRGIRFQPYPDRHLDRDVHAAGNAGRAAERLRRSLPLRSRVGQYRASHARRRRIHRGCSGRLWSARRRPYCVRDRIRPQHVVLHQDGRRLVRRKGACDRDGGAGHELAVRHRDGTDRVSVASRRPRLARAVRGVSCRLDRGRRGGVARLPPAPAERTRDSARVVRPAAPRSRADSDRRGGQGALDRTLATSST